MTTTIRSILVHQARKAGRGLVARARQPFVTDYLGKRDLTAFAGAMGFRAVSQVAEFMGNEWLAEQGHLARLRLDRPNTTMITVHGRKVGRGVRMKRIMPDEVGDATPYYHHRHLFEITGRRSLHAFVAIHDEMQLGNRHWSLGGIRIRNDFPSRDELLRDVLRVSRTMTHKCIIANVPLGGGQVEVTLNPMAGEREAALTDLAKALEYLKTIYVGRDMNVTQKDLELMARVAPHAIVGVPGTSIGGAQSISVAAEGLFLAIKQAAELHGIAMDELKVSLQGLGGVGRSLLDVLVRKNVSVTATDTKPEARAAAHHDYGERVTVLNDPAAIYNTAAHVFSPCAIEDVLSADTIPRLAKAGVSIVLGSANNVLQDEEKDVVQLRELGIDYYPEVVVGIGGILAAVSNIFGFHPMREITEIPDLVTKVHGFMEDDDMHGIEAGEQLVKDRRRQWSMERMFQT